MNRRPVFSRRGNYRASLIISATAAVMGFLPSTEAWGVNTTFTNANNNGLWGDPANWSNGVPGSSDTAQFAGIGSIIDLGGIARPVRTIITNSNGWTFGNGTFTSIQTVNVFDTALINANVVGNGIVGFTGTGVTVAGEISGNAIVQGAGAIFTGANTYTDRTRAFGLSLSGMGAAPNSSFFSAIGPPNGLTLDYGPIVVNKIGDNVNVQTVNSVLHVHNSANTAASESIGTLTVRSTANTIRVDSPAGSAAPMTLTAPVLNRVGIATALIDVDPSTGGRLMLGTAPQQIGGIIPWAIGVRGGLPSFVTYDNALGVRPLDLNSEYASAISPGVSTSNVRLTAGQSLTASATINSLAVFGTGVGVQLGNGVQLSLTSGAVSIAAPATPGMVDSMSGPGQLVLPNEGVLHVGASASDTNTYRIAAPVITPSLIKSGAATLTLAGANAIAGDVYVNQGTLVSAVAGALGSGAGTIHIGVNSALNFAATSQSYGTLSIDAAYVVVEGSSTLNTSRTANLRIDDNVAVTFAHLAGTGQLFMRGGGTLQFTGDSPIPNFMTIEAHEGAIQIDGTIRPVTPGGNEDTNKTLEAFDSAIITGSGSIYGSVIGNIDPGGVDSTARLIVNRLSNFNGGRVGIDLAGTVAGDGYDQLSVLLNGSLTDRILDVDLLNNFSPVLGTQFTIIDDTFTGAVTGTFTGLPQGAVFFADGRAFQIDYLGGDGNDVVLTAVVPEPSSLIFAFAPLAAIACAGSRRRRVL